MNDCFVLKGNICQTLHPKELDLHENAYAVCVDGVSKGVFDTLPEEYTSLPLYDHAVHCAVVSSGSGYGIVHGPL